MSIRIGGINLSLGSLFGVVTGVIGVLSDPSVLALLPARASSVITVAGIVIAAVSKALVHDPANPQ